MDYAGIENSGIGVKVLVAGFRGFTLLAGQYLAEENLGCDSPYLCAMDLGLVTAMAQRFQPQAKVVHEPEPLCKERGGSYCQYTVTW